MEETFNQYSDITDETNRTFCHNVTMDRVYFCVENVYLLNAWSFIPLVTKRMTIAYKLSIKMTFVNKTSTNGTLVLLDTY